MGVLTAVYRVPQRVADRIIGEPDLVDVLQYPDEHEPAELDLSDSPPSVGVDKAWEEIISVLRGTGHSMASDALVNGEDVEPESGAEVRVISATAVRAAAPAFASIDTNGLVAMALEREVTDDERPLDMRAARYVVRHLEKVIGFWKAAADAGEAIVVVTS